MTTASDPLVIREIRVHPLRVRLPKAQKTSQALWDALEIVVVEVETNDGIVGIGEALARRGAVGYARFITDALVPRLVGQDAQDRRRLWKLMRSTLTGRPGGQIIEAIAAIDIALWDIAGKAAGVPVHKLLGGMGRERVRAYASSINWLDDATVEAEVAHVLALGFREIKVKLGRDVPEAIARARLVRRLAPDALLGVDANWAYDVPEAMQIGRALADLGYDFFEEPIVPEDREGYRQLARHLPIRIAAGESDFVASEALVSLSDRSLGMIQPDVTRSGGITETWRIAELAASHNVAYAPHVGWSGGICVAASLHLAAAAESFRTFECMVFDNPLRTALCQPLVGDSTQLVEGHVRVPQSPGLGVSLDQQVLRHHLIA
ncbi:mandelate racemase/muconate lactonizing enzyme family protein [Pelagibacterium sediminicola]|uniref:mandelate racemase/muconate lactonizing enzyme family protein n=1 Tax=Pelagibacterium sediminicola TaxID=2248761 RepID=UPI000E30B5A2|nr:mandelate racemase/muconate lactonizing enzyme family protein [Pelagibacterium sediminicola]